MTVLNVTGLKEESVVQPGEDGTYAESRGGTEMMMDGLKARVDSELLEKFNIICSRFRKIDLNKPNILWLHDTWDDPESQHLKEEENLKKFMKLVFVSNYQQQTFNMGLGVPYSAGIVLQNAIEPIEVHEKPDPNECINLIYHTTPHRGLDILAPVFEFLVKHQEENNGRKMHLDVYSSFKIYGWEQRDQQHAEAIDKCKEHPNITYHGYQANPVIREALKKAHIYAYPNIWPETSGISVLEAMSAGCQIVCSNFAALPETTANFAAMYNFEEDANKPANVFANMLLQAINMYGNEVVHDKLNFQAQYVNNFYNWDFRAAQWKGFLQSMENAL